MFDKLYKEANDEIPLNTALMEQLKIEASKSRKKSYSGFIYRYGYAAAAIVLVAVSANVLPKMTEEHKVTPPIPAVIRSAETEPLQNVAKQDTAIPISKEKARVASNDKITPMASAEQADVSAPQGEEIISSDQTATSSTALSQPEEDAKSSRMMEHEPATAMHYDTEELTFPEYLEKFGFSYTEDKLPEGLVLTGENTVYTGGETDNENSLYTLYYQGEDKSMSITLYPEGEPVRKMIEGIGKSTENCVFEEKGEDECKAYIVKEERGFVIESKGIEKEEINEFINSLN